MKIKSKKVQRKLATKAEKAPVFTREAHTIKSVFAAALATGTDTIRSWAGKEINDKLVNTLVNGGEKLTSVRLAKTPGKVLVIEGAKKAFAVPVVAQSGDTYEVAVDKRPDDSWAKSYDTVAKARKTLRGSVSALKAAYGAGKVHILGKDAALKFLKGLKVDKAGLAQVQAA